MSSIKRTRILPLQIAFSSTHCASSEGGSLQLPPRPPRNASLAGTVTYHTSYLFLHTQQSSKDWPRTFSSSSLFSELQQKLGERHGRVNFCWDPGEQQPVAIGGFKDSYKATLWKTLAHQGALARRVDIPLISSDNVGFILDKFFSDDRELTEEEPVNEPYFYVCTHGQRDCRCGVRGGDFVESLRNELQCRGMLRDRTGKPRVFEVGHIGGHKNAPNVIVFPQGDWYGNLAPSDVPALLDHWFDTIGNHSRRSPNTLQWRGRMDHLKSLGYDLADGSNPWHNN